MVIYFTGNMTRQNMIMLYLSSTIQTLLSAPEFHRFSPEYSGVADFHRRSGISPCPEESVHKNAANVSEIIILQKKKCLFRM